MRICYKISIFHFLIYKLNINLIIHLDCVLIRKIMSKNNKILGKIVILLVGYTNKRIIIKNLMLGNLFWDQLYSRFVISPIID